MNRIDSNVGQASRLSRPLWRGRESFSRPQAAPCAPEPTSNPSEEGNFRAAEDCLLPSREGSGVGRFMESLLSLWRLHWDHEPERAQSRAGVLPARADWKPALPDRRDACPTLRFMERERIVLCLCAVLVK